MPKGKSNKRYKREFKKKIIKTMLEEKLGYRETVQRLEIRSDKQVRDSLRDKALQAAASLYQGQGGAAGSFCEGQFSV